MARRVRGWQGQKRDGNEQAIRTALIRAGLTVQPLSQVGVPDLLIGGQARHICPQCGAIIAQPYNWLLEVKQRRGALTADQDRFKAEWGGQVEIARTVTEALEKVGKHGS